MKEITSPSQSAGSPFDTTTICLIQMIAITKKKIFQIFVLLQIPTFSLHIHLPHGKIKFLNITFFYHSIFHIGPVFLGGSMR